MPDMWKLSLIPGEEKKSHKKKEKKYISESEITLDGRDKCWVTLNNIMNTQEEKKEKKKIIQKPFWEHKKNIEWWKKMKKKIYIRKSIPSLHEIDTRRRRWRRRRKKLHAKLVIAHSTKTIDFWWGLQFTKMET